MDKRNTFTEIIEKNDKKELAGLVFSSCGSK